MNPKDAIKEVKRCADALAHALNRAAEEGQHVTVEIVDRTRSGDRADRREVIVHHHDEAAGIRPEDLHSANDS